MDCSDAVKQVALVRAYGAASLDNDDEKDLKEFDREAFRPFLSAIYGLKGHEYLQYLANGKKDSSDSQAVARKVYEEAASQGYPGAILVIETSTMHDLISPKKDLANMLSRFIGRGDEEIDFFYGKSLLQNSALGSHDFKVGLKSMADSGLIKIHIPEPNSNYRPYDGETKFDRFFNYWITMKDPGSTYFFWNGAYFLSDGSVLVPSLEKWEAMIRNTMPE